MKAILILFALLVANSMAANYTFANIAGGSWKTESNWDPVGIPGPEDDVLFTFISGMSFVDVTLDDDITVNSIVVDIHFYTFKSGSLTVQNDCYISGSTFYKLNITVNGDATLESTGVNEGILCDSCVLNIKKSLIALPKLSGSTMLANSAMIVTWPGTTTTIFHNAFADTDQVGTLINYGTLIFKSSFGIGSTPWGDPPIAQTGPWIDFKNYGDIRIQVDDSPLGCTVYNNIRNWDFADGKITLRLVQESTTNEQGRFDFSYEFNDGFSSGGRHDYYEIHIAGDVHVIFDQIDVLPGQTERPFNPKVGDFFPVFSNFHKYSGKIRTLTVEGLPIGLTLGRKSVLDPGTYRLHYGVVICSSSDTACIESSGEVETPNDALSPLSVSSSSSFIESSLMAALAIIALLF